MIHRAASTGLALVLLAGAATSFGAETIRPARERFATEDVKEIPDFQRHVLPLMGRLGCNSRSCHGSFQGQGGFRLSLFGYDFKTDHEALLKSGADRVVVDNAEASKIIQKPTLTIPHKGGKRMEEESWQYRILVRWIEEGAKGATGPSHFERLEVTPSEVVFKAAGEKVPLRVVAHWSDGSREDVTCITRFRTNDESIAEIDNDGVITSKGKGDTHVVAFYDNGIAVTQVLLPVSEQVGPEYPKVPTPTRIDELVVNKLRKLGVVPSEVCSDAEFLRRVSLDMTGTLPTPEESSAFLADSSPDKRARKVDELLGRPAYAAWWTNKLCDLTGNSERSLLIDGARGKVSPLWYEWIYRRVKENMPYDRIVEGIVLATSRKPGQSYEDYIKEESSYYRTKDPADFSAKETMPYYWARRNFRKPEEKALGFSYTFLGVHLECAQCHKHPFDQWTQDDFTQFTAFFQPVAFAGPRDKEGRELVKKLTDDLGLKNGNGNDRRKKMTQAAQAGKPIPWLEVYALANGQAARQRGNKGNQPKSARVITPKLLGGEVVSIAGQDDPRKPLMEWMRSKENPYFARAFVNRAWANYFGVGINEPADDMNLANPPSNPALLDYLAEGFIAHDFDMKWLHREIVTSQAYQRSWHANDTNRLDERNFSRALVRRLPAEVLIDAVAQVTAAPKELVERARTIDERAIGPKGAPGIQARNGGKALYASRVFGRSTREINCDCSRTDSPNLLQSIYMQNDQDVLSSIDRPGGWLDESAGAYVKARARRQAPPPDSKAIENTARRVAALEKEIRELRKKDREERADRMEDQQLAPLRRTLEAMRRHAKQDDSPMPTFDVDATIREAYLRTLNRRPEESEVAIARSHFAQAENEQKGQRDLLWALINTKEFITNH